jgi:hypothetical protein
MTELKPRGCLWFLHDPRRGASMSWRWGRAPLLVLGVGLVHLPAAAMPSMGGYRWVILGVGVLSLLLGLALLHIQLAGRDRIALARFEAKRAREAEAEAAAPVDPAADGAERGDDEPPDERAPDDAAPPSPGAGAST